MIVVVLAEMKEGGESVCMIDQTREREGKCGWVEGKGEKRKSNPISNTGKASGRFPNLLANTTFVWFLKKTI